MCYFTIFKIYNFIQKKFFVNNAIKLKSNDYNLMECHRFIFTSQYFLMHFIFWCFWVVEFLPKILKKVKWKFISKWPRGSLERCFLRPLSNRIVKIIYNSYCISNHVGKCPMTPTGNALLSCLENKELEWGRTAAENATTTMIII